MKQEGRHIIREVNQVKMGYITLKSKGNFKKTYSFLERAKESLNLGMLDKYGRMGVEALEAATPVDTGRTAASWYYEIERDGKNVSLSFFNSNIQNGIPIAIILQYGHGTKNGGYVKGIDYINPALTPVFEKLAEEAWKGLN